MPPGTVRDAAQLGTGMHTTTTFRGMTHPPHGWVGLATQRRAHQLERQWHARTGGHQLTLHGLPEVGGSGPRASHGMLWMVCSHR